MDRFEAMRLFAAVAEAQSFSAAARRQGLSAPAVTRTIAALEELLGVRLLVRTTRRVRLTEAGERYLLDCRRILADLQEAEEAAAGSHATPRGLLSITAPVMFGHLHVSPILLRFMERYPEVRIRALFIDRVASLIDEGLDVGIRIGELPDSSLMALRVGQVRRLVCAAPAYLERHGTPRHPAELSGHRLVTASGGPQSSEWRFQERGEPLAVALRPQFVVNTNEAAIRAASAGWGLTRRLSYQVAGLLGSGQLRTVLDDFEPPPLPIHIVHQEGRRTSAKVRAFVDFIAAALRGNPELNPGAAETAAAGQ